MKPHRTDGISLSFGLIFLLVALWWAVSRVVDIHLPAVGWLVAAALIVFGVIGLLGAIRSGRPPAPQPAPVAQPAAEPEVPGGLPPEMHASIVRELLEEPGERFRKEHPEPQAQTQPQPPAQTLSQTQSEPVAEKPHQD